MGKVRFTKGSVALWAICLWLSGCATMCKQQVPPGHVGMCRTLNGFEGQVLSPGYHSCWGSDAQMYLIEVISRLRLILCALAGVDTGPVQSWCKV